MTIHAGTTIDMYYDSLLFRWQTSLRAWSSRMGNLPLHIYGYNNEHAVIVYTAVKDVGSHAIVFKSLRFGPFTLKRNPGVFKLKQGLQRFQKSPV